MYIGEDGARYEVTKFANDVDASGFIGNAPDITLQQGLGTQASKGAKGQGMSSNPFDWDDEKDARSKREEVENVAGFAFEAGHWTFVREIPVWRVFQDDPTQVIYWDESEEEKVKNAIQQTSGQACASPCVIA